jgi:uncharacterized SAM-binding protein YcdF (DUF218 family)
LLRNRASLILIALGMIGVLDTIIVLQLNGGKNLGTILPGVLGVLMILWGLTRDFIKRHLKDRFFRLRQIFRLGLYTLLLSFILVEGLLLINTRDEVSEPVEYLIILGAGLNGDQLSWTLWERMNKGLTVLQENPKMKVVVSGGQGPGEWITEAEGMRRFLVKHGVAEERILKEEKSTSTMENFRYSRELLDQQLGFEVSKPVMVITNDFHVLRSKILARRNGLNPVGIPSPTPWYLRPNVYLREYFALVKSLVFDR